MLRCGCCDTGGGELCNHRWREPGVPCDVYLRLVSSYDYCEGPEKECREKAFAWTWFGSKVGKKTLRGSGFSARSPSPSSSPPLPPGSVLFPSPELRFSGVTTSLSPSYFPSASLCVSSPHLPCLLLWFILLSWFPPFFLLSFSFLSPSFPHFPSFSQGWGRNAGTQVGTRSWGEWFMPRASFQQHLQIQSPEFNSIFQLHYPPLHGFSDSCFLENCLNTFAYEMLKPQLIGLNEWLQK